MPERCLWAGNDPLYLDYHDHEWGLPVHEERALFEALVLDGAQAGLSWITILRKRENYRTAFDQFDPARVAAYGQAKIDELLLNPGIIRNRQKISSAIKNAQAFLRIQKEFGSFDSYLWAFVEGAPIINAWKTDAQIPALTPLSEKLSKDLKQRGFSFVGPTIIYAFMQAVGMVNDHITSCFRYTQLGGETPG